MNRLTRYRLDRLRHRIRSQYGLFSSLEEADAYVAHYGREVDAFFRRQHEWRRTRAEFWQALPFYAPVIAAAVLAVIFITGPASYAGANIIRDHEWVRHLLQCMGLL